MLFIFILEIIGTIAFAVSGAITAIQKKMDMLGVCIMGIVTACGGGVFRDLLLGKVPPVLFTRPVYAATATVASIIAFIPAIRTSHFLQKHHFDRIVFLADALGLGIFTTVGVNAVQSAGYGENCFFPLPWGLLPGSAAASSGMFWQGTAPISLSSTSTPAPRWPAPSSTILPSRCSPSFRPCLPVHW